MPTPRKPRNRVGNKVFITERNDINTQTTSQQKDKHMNSSPVKVLISGIVLLVALVLTILAFKIRTVKGNELGIKETWSDGVVTNILQPKTYFLFPGWSQTVYTYDASSQVFVMNDKAAHQEKGLGREKDAYLVQSKEGQDMKISLNLRWRLDPSKLVSIHKTVRHDIEEKIIRPVVMRVVKDEATKMNAIQAYSGEGLVQLQSNIQTALAGAGEGKELSDRGVIVENFVIEHIELDPKYIEEIKGKQIATQQTLRATEEQKAAEAKALVAKAVAQADMNTQVVGAERDAKIKVVTAQAAMEQQVLAAKAEQQKLTITAEGEKQKLTLEAEGKQSAMEAIAKGTLAMGQAEAKATELKLKAWEGAGTDAYRQVEVAKAMATGFQNIQGYLPEKITINTLSGNFLEALAAITGRAPGTVPVTK